MKAKFLALILITLALTGCGDKLKGMDKKIVEISHMYYTSGVNCGLSTSNKELCEQFYQATVNSNETH